MSTDGFIPSEESGGGDFYAPTKLKGGGFVAIERLGPPGLTTRTYYPDGSGDGSSHDSYEHHVSSRPPTDDTTVEGGDSLDAVGEEEISSSDDTRHNYAAAPYWTDYAAIQTRFTIQEASADVTQIDVTAEGYAYQADGGSGVNPDFDVYIWNYNTSSWDSVGGHTNKSDTVVTNTFSESPGNYVNASKEVVICCIGPPGDGTFFYPSQIWIDQIKLEVGS